ALNQGGIAPEIKDSSGEEPDYVGILGQTGKGLVNNWVNDIKTNLATATLRIYGTAEEYAGKLGISVPDSCTTNQKLIPLTQTAPDVFSVLIPDSVTIINPDVSSCPVPEEDFKLSIIIGKDNYALLEKNNWQGVYVYSLDSSHKDERWYINKAYLFSPDSLTKDRLIILLSKGTEYNFVVEESDNTRSFNYYKEAVRIPSSGQPITDSMTELDLTGYSFANTKSALISGPIAGKAQQAVSLASISVESGIIQLQIDLGNYPLTQAQKQELNQQIIDELKSSLSSSCKVTEPAKEQISCPEGSYQIADGTIFIPLAGTPGFLIIPDKKLIQVSKTAPATVKLTAQPAGNLTNLQVKSVNGLTCTPNNKNNFVCLENKVPHIVYLAKGTKQIEIELQDYSNEKMFFAVGEKGKVKQPSTTANNSSDYPSASVSNSIVEFDAFTAQFKNGKYFSIDSYSGQKIVLNNWDETSLEFYACQDKDADNKCDLYYVNGTEKHGATFIEPNYEAASITIKSESKKAVVKLNLNLPEPVLYLDEFIQESLNEIEGQLEGQGITCTPSGEGTLECDEGNVYLNNFSLETPQGNFNAAPQQGSGGTLIIEGREIEVTITLTPESQGQQTTTVRISDQPPSQDCIIAMDNAEKFEAEIEKYSEIFSMDPNLTRAIIQAESSFKANAIGKDSSGEKSSYGLMQIHESNLTAWTDIFGSGWSTTETWKDVNKNIQAGTRYFNSGNFLGSLEKWVNNLSCSQESLSTVLSGSGEVQATWKTALKIARYNCSQVSCDSIGCSTTRETYVPKVIAWYRVFAENYGKKAELGKDYCKPTKIVSTGVVPPIETPAACSTCNTIVECLACVDYKFVSGIAKTE
ncbi:transglycosylase SLT domain-containing protein, partial [Candidatus Micrarchaeota archaeon]|nr:transglycosylase SLT domain-containing protein [Candidatus Micrarchaeota archaeon]